MFVSMELEARKSPKGWKPRLVMLALCPIRVLKTEHRKQQGHLFASLSNCAMFSKRPSSGALKRLRMMGRTIILTAGYNILRYSLRLNTEEAVSIFKIRVDGKILLIITYTQSD